jgi:hypothetical protein
MLRARRVRLTGLGLALAVGVAAAATDHHLHVVSPELSRVMASLAEQDPATAKLLDPEVTKVRGTAEVLAMLDAAGLRQGVLLSGAYMYSSPLLAGQKLDAVALLRSENAYNVAAAEASAGRLLAFIGLNPRAPESRTELDHWVKHGGVTGVKLHFGNSAIDFHDAEQGWPSWFIRAAGRSMAPWRLGFWWSRCCRRPARHRCSWHMAAVGAVWTRRLWTRSRCTWLPSSVVRPEPRGW